MHAAAAADRSAAAATLPAWAQLVRDLGFPIVVACALLYQNVVAIPQAIDRLVERIGHVEAAERQKTDALQQLVQRIDAVLRTK